MENRNLTEGNILKALLTFAFPVFAALFLQAMYGAVDLLIVGKFAEVADQSGVASGSMFMGLPTMALTGMAMGVTVWVAECVGRKDDKNMGKGIGTGIALFALLAVILTVFIVPFAPNLAEWIHAPKEAFYQTTAYIRVCGIGMVFIVAYNVIGAVFRGIGDSNTPLFTVAIACVVNVVGDLFFVAVLKMGATGAAIATVFAQGVSVVLSLFLIRRKNHSISLSKKDIRFHGVCVKKILFIGLPIAFQELLVQFSFLFIQTVVNGMGVTASAGVGVAEKVCAFLMLVGSAYMQSMSAFVAQNNGAGKRDRAKKGLFYGIASAVLAGAIMGSMAFWGGSVLASLFTNDGAVIYNAHSYLKAYAIDCLLTAVFFCMVGYFNGCEKSLFVMIQGLVGAFCVRIPVVYLMSKMEGVTLFHIGLGTPAASLVQIILCVAAYLYY